MKAWITKYALTRGVFVVDAEPYQGTSGMIGWRNDHDYRAFAHGEGREWHRTPEVALARAEKMRRDKIASLRKQIAKLENLTIKVPE